MTMKIRREYSHLPPRGLFRRIAKKQGGWTGWTYWADGRSRDGYHVSGMGRTARSAVNDFRMERKPTRG